MEPDDGTARWCTVDVGGSPVEYLECGTGDPLVMGHPVGGGVALQLAHDRPELVRSLTLLNSAGGSPPEAGRDSRRVGLMSRPWGRCALSASSRPGSPDAFGRVLREALVVHATVERSGHGRALADAAHQHPAP